MSDSDDLNYFKPTIYEPAQSLSFFIISELEYFYAYMIMFIISKHNTSYEHIQNSLTPALYCVIKTTVVNIQCTNARTCLETILPFNHDLLSISSKKNGLCN